MNMFKKNSILKKIMSIVLIATFITLDASWSYPFQPSSQNYKLAYQVIFQKEMMDGQSDKFQEAFFGDIGLIYSVLTIGKLLLGHPSEDIATVSPSRLKSVITKIFEERGLEKDLTGLDLSQVELTNGIVSIPYIRDDRRYTIQIIRKDSPEAVGVTTGFESQNYIISIGYEGDVVSAALKKAETIFTNEARKAKSDENTLKIALKYLEQWLREDGFKEYREALLALIELAEEDEVAAKELYDSFWRVIPFGTGGRRWRMGIGPNRMNAYMAAMTAQGHVEYLKQQYPEQVERGDVCVGAWDVRAFKRFFAEIPSLRKYREVIEEKCPVLRGLSSEDISKTVGLVYAGNGIKYLHPAEMRETPWLSFVINRFSEIVKKKPFNENTRVGRVLNSIVNVMAGTVLSSSHNPYDNNGTKYYEESGAQAPPQIVQKLMDIGDKVEAIGYYAKDILSEQGRDAAFEKAVKDGQIIVLEGENLKILDEAYFASVIEEIKSVYTDEEWERLKPWFEKLYVSVNFLNGTGFTGLLPILEKLKFNVLRSEEDVPSWEFTEGYGNIPNPEAEKSFNTAMQIGIRRTLDWVFDNRNTEIKSVIDEDGVEIPLGTLEAEHKGTFEGTEELLGHIMHTRSKFVRGLVLDVNERNENAIRAFTVLNNICLLTDPDADRVGLGMVKIERTKDGMRVHWVSGNDNDEAGIILFRYRLEKLRDMASRGELIEYIEKSRKESGKAPSKTGAYQLIMVNTVVSNPLEIIIAEKLSREISELTGGRVTVKVVTHHVGFKFAGEIIDIINKGVFTGIPGELMKRIGINLDEAFFVMSSEEGEGSLIGYKGSIDKDSGTTGLALSVLAAEQLSKGQTMYDYLMETYRIYGYSKTYLEPMVMTGEYGFIMINSNIMGYLRKEVLPKVKAGEEVAWGRFKLTEGYDHYDLVTQMSTVIEHIEGLKSSPEKLKSALDNVEAKQPWEKELVDRLRTYPETLSINDTPLWPQAIREAVNIIEFDLVLPSGEKIKIVLRPSGTEPKQKNVVTVVGLPLGEGENLEEYIGRVNMLNREVMDQAMIACYKASDAEYDSLIEEQTGRYKIADLNPQDLRELLKIFPIIVLCETKLAIYFPLRDYVIQVSGRLAELSTTEGFNREYAEIRSKIERYLVNFKEENGVDFIEESLILSLRNQVNALPAVDLNDKKPKAIYIQAILWFGKEIGERHFVRLLNEIKNIDRQDIQRALKSWSLESEVPLPRNNPAGKDEAETFADNIVVSIIVLARNAHEQDQNLIVGLETDWIPGYEQGRLQHGAINPLIQEIDSIETKLMSMGYDNIRFIHERSKELAGAIKKEADDTGTDYSNVVVLASKDTIGANEFNPLRSAPGKEGAVLASVDPTELIKFYSEHAEDSTKQLYIKIMLMLSIALDLACGKALPTHSIITSHSKELRIIEFLPKAEPKDYQELQERYKAEQQALEAA